MLGLEATRMANIDLSEKISYQSNSVIQPDKKQTDINTDAGKQIPKASGERTE